MLSIKEIVKDTTSVFSYASAGVLYYVVSIGDEKYQFPLDMNDKEDVGSTAFVSEYRTITLMRYVRKALKSGDFIKIK